MSSGYGVRTKNGRCYGLWMDYRSCMYHTDQPKNCSPNLEDFVECLHHYKESEWHKKVERKIYEKRDENQSLFKKESKKPETSSHH
ncbi:hypothetical protein C9374_002093 [Naegleria lovaniensis]|uniref:NADH dehydrogenase [ubiquinone] iron-sulfur protein 5 n=1 Tax=Naegleria lovaniensis TaxID=51637 RepID=A0AA88GWE7_NAELO|nr:uncharacterized protein C9374_002093 [Naegleria lovaniensis]KAG2387058.1 hypothetical protein C9374_002093 [Naegleria lovaniensis]